MHEWDSARLGGLCPFRGQSSLFTCRVSKRISFSQPLHGIHSSPCWAGLYVPLFQKLWDERWVRALRGICIQNLGTFVRQVNDEWLTHRQQAATVWAESGLKPWFFWLHTLWSVIPQLVHLEICKVKMPVLFTEKSTYRWSHAVQTCAGPGPAVWTCVSACA